MATRQTLVTLKEECKKRSILFPNRVKKSELLTLLGFSVSQSSSDCIKPTIKWVGGKSQLLGKILPKFPSQISSYYEPFLGGGSVLLGLLSFVKLGKIQCEHFSVSDINPVLIQYYNHLKDSPDRLADTIEELFETFNDLSKEDEKSRLAYYHRIRSLFNQKHQSVEQSAYFHFLNKTCYRGLYRENSKGNFNTPYEKSKNAQILRLDRDHLLEVSELIQPVEFVVQSFTNVFSIVKQGDFVYLDPPYVQIDKSSFDNYSAGGFDVHSELFRQIHQLKNQNISFLMSNSNTEQVNQEFIGYQIERIECRRRIHSSNPSSMETEVLIS